MVSRRSQIWPKKYNDTYLGKKGTRPRVVQQQQFTYAYLFGAVCVTNGNTEALVAPLSNMNVMKSHLALISEATEAGRHVVVVIEVVK